MIDLYFWPTPNGYKVSILLEELGLDYAVHPVRIGKGEQHDPAYLAINPNGKIPTIVDHDGPGGPDDAPMAVFESGAILMYLAEKEGRFLPTDARGRSEVVQWLMFQMGGIGPLLGQAHHFRKYARDEHGDHGYAAERYTREAGRLYGVLDRRLAEVEYLAGDYSIADMAVYPWLRPYKWQGQDLADFEHVQRWYSAMRARPAVQRGLGVLKDRIDLGKGKKPEGEAWDILFGEKQASMGQKDG